MVPVQLPTNAGFDEWRTAARGLLLQQVPPEQVVWGQDVLLLPVGVDGSVDDVQLSRCPAQVPTAFFSAAESAACFRDPGRWALLYRVLWRLTHGESRLLDIVVDDDVHRLLSMEKAVRRDVHKMKAFVRFRRVEATGGAATGGEEHYVAWHRPDHLIVRRVAPWFRDRFGVMGWTILTPDASVSWNGTDLEYGRGVPRSGAPEGDELEDLWRTYYRATFNPARVKLKAMRREMPLKHWATLPETGEIDRLLREAPARVEDMMKRQSKAAAARSGQRVPDGETTAADCPTGTSAAEFIPHSTSLAVLREAVNHCRGCQIYCNATQGVFGEGPKDASVMLVGEQPGDQEDKAGKPFVGPAGKLLDEALRTAGVPRDEVYITNAVKHFKWEPRGTRRLHAKPSAREVGACRPWLEAEINLVRPQIVVCLGATAAQSLLGPAFRITKQRGEMITESKWAPAVTATFHPSALLRIPEADAREQVYQSFVDDLRQVARQMKALQKAKPGKRPARADEPAGGEGVHPSLFGNGDAPRPSAR